MATVLGVTASLRNARFGAGSDRLVEEIERLKTEAELVEYLKSQTAIRAEDFLEAGRRQGLPFDQLYANLRRSPGERGLSNSEAALAAGLWGAKEAGAKIKHCGLATYFPMTGERRNLDQLRAQVLAADAILLSGPVYFGDRGSPAQEFIEFLREDKACAAHIRDKIYGGIAVGAKRNGGQETTLIYQLMDLTNLNMLAVGNDSDSTAQYGGTALAGDVGAMWKDQEGIKTSVGTGRRVALVADMMATGQRHRLRDGAKIAVWLLQDREDHRGRELIQKFCSEVEAKQPGVKFEVLDFTEEQTYRCIACDVCPIDVGSSHEYRCIVRAEGDTFVRHHNQLLEPDAFLIAAYSPVDRSNVRNIYQRFIERTRYIRRDDYSIGDRLTAPFVISEVNANQNLHIRMLTSFIRHHTVLHHPLIGVEFEDKVLNWNTLIQQGTSFAANTVQLTTGRLLADEKETAARYYNPIGYTISSEKRSEDVRLGKTSAIQDERLKVIEQTRERRVLPLVESER